jgi:hypothetical protein
MIIEFRPWLSTKVTPGRYQLLMAAMSLLINLNGVAMQKLETDRWSEIGTRDDSVIVDEFSSDCLSNLLALLTKFGISVDEDLITDEHLALLVEMLNALLDLDNYELPQDIISTIDAGELVDQTLVELLSMVSGVNQIAFLDLSITASPALLHAIRTSAVQKLDNATEVDLEAPNTELMDSFKLVVDKLSLPSVDPVVHHFKTTGKLGLSLESYVSLLSDVLVDDDSEVLAKRWVLISIASSTHSSHMGTVFELVYINDIKRLMSVSRIYRKLMAGLE